MAINLRTRSRRLALPLLAGGLFIFALVSVVQPPRTRADPPVAPPRNAIGNTVAGVGIIEPQSELIEIATELPGVVRTLHVSPGERIGKGAPLFTLDDRAARADLAAAEAALRQAEVVLADERQKLGMIEAVEDRRAVSTDELQRRRFAVERALAARDQARAQVEAQRVGLARLTVTAPVEGRVYRINIRPGEYAANGGATPLLTMGADARLHVRVEIDEADAARFDSSGRAYGVLRGAPDRHIPLRFERAEPQVIEKRALSGGSERVDTRVVELIYSFDSAATRAFLGQRMDVFVAAAGSRSNG